jgi:ribosomal protein S7
MLLYNYRKFYRMRFPNLESNLFKFSRVIMKNGKSGISYNLVCQSLKSIRLVEHTAPIHLLQTAILNVMPYVELRSKLVAGRTYQIPSSLVHSRQHKLGIQ